MEKTKFTAVSIDTGSYELLGKLAEYAKLPKATYLRLLIRGWRLKDVLLAGIARWCKFAIF